MQKLFRAFALMMAVMLVAVFVVGCGDDDDDDTTETPATVTATTPADGGQIAANGTLTITFDNPPGDVTVNGSPATVTGKTATWTATGLTAGQSASIAIAWTIAGGGSKTITLNVQAEDTTPPTISGGTVSDGDKDVEPDPLNTDGITIDFSEAVNRGQITIMPEGGNDLGWLPTWTDTSVTIVPPKGAELGMETTYLLDITGVKDKAGNALPDTTITFVTKAKEQ